MTLSDEKSGGDISGCDLSASHNCLSYFTTVLCQTLLDGWNSVYHDPRSVVWVYTVCTNLSVQLLKVSTVDRLDSVDCTEKEQ